MGLGAAASFLLLRSAKNRVRAQVRRLKQPKYLIATAVGFFYLWTVFLRRLVVSPGPPVTEPGVLIGFELILVAGAVLTIFASWILGTNRSALMFSEAEIQFFFAGPCSRRQVLNYRLVRMLVVSAISAAVSTLLFGRGSGNSLFFLLGAWLSLSALGLHLTGVSLTRASLAEHGRFGLTRRLVTLAMVALVLGAVGWWTFVTRKPALPEGTDSGQWLAWIRAFSTSGPLAWLLWPIRAPIRVALAQDWATFLWALPGALGVVAANYLWALSSDHAFEESSLAAAEERVKRLEARRAGREAEPLPVTARKPWFKLAPRGRPELALTWKAAVATQRGMRMTLLPALLGFGGAAVMVAISLRSQTEGSAIAVAVVCATMAILAAVFGPSMLRVDLRRDLAQADMLRALPLSGRQVVLGELIAPAAFLTVLQWVLWLLAFGISARVTMMNLTFGERAAIALAGALVGPPLTVAGLMVHNGAALLFPAWISPDGQGQRGIEALGQRLLTFAGSLLALAVGVVPAAIVAGMVTVPLAFWADWGLRALPVGAVAAAAVVSFEAFLALHLLGRTFDRLDITR